MSKVREILEESLGNPETFIGVLDDLVYSFVISSFVGEMRRVLTEEEVGLKKLKDDKEAYETGLAELEKLRILIEKLDVIKQPDDVEIRKIISNRYMK